MKPCRVCRQNPRQHGLALCKPCASAKKKEKERVKKIKAAAIREKKRLSVKRLARKLFPIHAKFIRMRDKGKPCVTCGAPWKDTHQCGHYMSRGYHATAWDENNSHSQCYRCNCILKGRVAEHAHKIDEMYGPGTAEAIYQKARNPLYKDNPYEMLEKIAYYEAKVQALEEMR
jgi:hypothetical protein